MNITTVLFLIMLLHTLILGIRGKVEAPTLYIVCMLTCIWMNL